MICGWNRCARRTSAIVCPSAELSPTRSTRTSTDPVKLIVPANTSLAPPTPAALSTGIDSPVTECTSDSFALVAEWMLENLAEDLTVDQLARKALMSGRTFARRFRADMGTTPAAWLNRQRLLRAQQLLEQSDSSLEQIAQDTGFGTAAVMRHHFVKVLQTSPQSYRRAFGMREAG